MTLVSIITPSYNQAEYLEETILSVLNQTYPQIEYLLVDGGSTDGSLEIIQKYSDRFAWWVSEPDSGQAEAINKGMTRANGEVITWLNSDDLYLPGAITEAVSALQSAPETGMVFGDAMTIDSRGELLNKLTFGDWGLAELMRFRIICQPAVYMRRAVLKQTGFLDPSYQFLLDHQLWIRIARLAPILHIPKRWAAARHHPQAKNVALAAGFGQEAFRILEWMETQPDLEPQIRRDRRRIEAGAYRLEARYLLDGDLAGPALRSYGNALIRSPRFALQHWHRMLYAVLSLVGGQTLAKSYYQRRHHKQTQTLDV